MLSRISSFSGPLSNFFSTIKGFTLLGLILRYEIKDTTSYSGTTTVTDLADNSDATIYNGATYSTNGYINFDGANDYLFTNTSLNSKLSPPNTSIVISCFTWIYPQDNGVILTEQGTTTIDSSWFDSQIEIVSGAIKFRVWPSLTGITSTIPISFNKWYYVGFTYDGTTLRGYVNEQLAGTLNLTRQAPFSTGRDLYYTLAASTSTNLGDGTFAKMKLGAFHVYNTALSQQQVLNNFNATKNNYIHTDNLSIWIDVNDPASYSGTGSTVSDISGNSFTHSLASGSVFSIASGVKAFDCNTGHIRVNGTGPTLSTSGYTYVAWARIKADSSNYRTLYRSNPNDHAILVQTGTDNLGFWDNDDLVSAFKDSGYDVTNIAETWVQYSVVGDNSSSIFYINDIQVGSVASGAGGNRHDYFGGIPGQPFGYVANMMLYNSKLTQAEIKRNYDALKHVYRDGNFVIDNLILNYNPKSLLSYPGSGTTVYNLSSGSLNGTLSNVTFQNTHFSFGGTNSQISISDNASLEPGSGDWTTEVWFNATSLTSSSVILGKFDNGGLSADVSYSIRTNTSSQIFSQIGNGTSVVNSNFYTVSLNTWYQVVYVWKNVSVNSLETYINGALVGTVSHSFTSILNTTNNLYLGSYNNGEYNQYFNGKIGITRIYNTALTTTQVNKNFEANRSIYGI